MSEQKPEKKVVSRTVAIALGIICIILAVGLMGAIADYTSIISGKDNTITTITNQENQLSTWLSGNVTAYNNYVSSHSHTNADYQNLQTQKTNLTNIVNLSDSATWVNDQTVSQTVGSYTYWTFSASYAGYVSVYVQSSTSGATYVEVIYSAYGVSYDNQIGVGSGGYSVTFPILPSSNIEIGVGNSNLINGATETVTITYYY